VTTTLSPPVPVPQVSVPDLSVHHRGNVTVVSLRGELDISGSSALQAYLNDIGPSTRSHCVLDLAGLAYIDCSCLSVLVGYCREIRARGSSFALARPQPIVRRILSVSGLLTWFEMHGPSQ
jgi:anti-sigma B factor antagonist